MQFQSTVRTSTKVLVAIFVVVALGTFVHVASTASHEATLEKQAQFKASEEIQLAAREKKGSAVAAK